MTPAELKAARLFMGLSHAALARLLGCSESQARSAELRHRMFVLDEHSEKLDRALYDFSMAIESLRPPYQGHGKCYFMIVYATDGDFDEDKENCIASHLPSAACHLAASYAAASQPDLENQNKTELIFWDADSYGEFEPHRPDTPERRQRWAAKRYSEIHHVQQ